MSRPVADLVAGALYAFGAHITTRREQLVASSSDHPAPAAAAIAEFLTLHGLAGAEVAPAVLDWSELVARAPTLDALQAQVKAALAEAAALERELDVLLNGVPTGAGLADLVALVRSREAVQIVNLADGMRINFRAPDGRRSTLHVQATLDGAQDLGIPHAVVEAMHDAIAAYPVAGEPLPVEAAA